MNILLRRSLFLISVLILSFSLCSSAQDKDSTGIATKPVTQFFTADQFETDSTSDISHSLANFQNYLPHNNLGNAGLAIAPVTISNSSISSGFQYAPNHFQNYFYDKTSLLFFNTRSPFSDLRYIIGSKQEQSFKLTFSYNVRKNWNITANFFRIRSEGFYLNQGTNDNFIALSTNFRSKRNRYWLLAAATYNFVQNVENGGIQDDSVFENSGNSDKKLIPVNLSQAKMSLLNQRIFLKQYFNLGKSPDDTSAIIPGSRFILSSSVENNLFRYKDNDPLSGFYPNIYHDSSRTHDSAYYFLVDNELAWKRTDNGKHRGAGDWLGLGFSIAHQFTNVKQWEIDSSFTSMQAGAQLYNTYSQKQFWFRLNYQMGLQGYNQGNSSLGLVLKKGLVNGLFFISLDGLSAAQQPDFIYYHYSTNHFSWNNTNLESVNTSSAGMTITSQHFNLSLSGKISLIENPVYFDNFAVARQYNGRVSVVSANLKKNFSLFNWHLDNDVTYQYVPDSTVIRLPEYILQHSLYYENDIRNIMRIQVGAGVYYSAAYYADAYMPATAQFYLQTEKKYGNYPFIDFFVNARVKTLRVFLKIDHLNAGWSKNTYLLTPQYPLNGRAFKIGFSWRFFD